MPTNVTNGRLCARAACREQACIVMLAVGLVGCLADPADLPASDLEGDDESSVALTTAALSGPRVIAAAGIASTGFSSAYAACPAGTVATGGGGQSNTIWSGGSGPGYLILSMPRQNSSGTPIGWDAWVSTAPGETGKVTARAYAICAKP